MSIPISLDKKGTRGYPSDTMNKTTTKKRKQGHGRHVRFPKDLDKWLAIQAKAEGLRSAPALVVYVMGQYRKQVENGMSAAA